MKKIVCAKCNDEKTNFLPEFIYCYDCCTQQEINDYIKPDLTHWMKGLKPWEKSAVLRNVFKEQKKLLKKELYYAQKDNETGCKGLGEGC